MECGTDVLLQDARDWGYAVPAVCISNLETIVAVYRAARAKKSPVLLQIYSAQKQFQSVGYGDLAAIIRQIGKAYPEVPYSIHLDHGASFEECREAVEAGLTSVMIDASRCEFDENIAISNLVRTLGNGIFIEAELGRVGGTEGDTLAESASLTEPAGLSEFLRQTDIDAVAVSVGNTHGHCSEPAKLNFEILEQLNDVSSVPLVLHGASGIPGDDIKKAVSMGICKINYYTDLADTFMETVRRSPEMDMLSVLRENTSNLQKRVERIIELCGSAERIS